MFSVYLYLDNFSSHSTFSLQNSSFGKKKVKAKKSPRKIFDTLSLFLRVRFPFFSEPYFSEDFTTHT